MYTCMASPFLFLCLFFLLCSTLMPSNSHSVNPIINGGSGFAVPLIHRDSPQSPLYNHSMTSHDRQLAALHRSVSRLNHLRSSAATANPSQSGPPDLTASLLPSDSEYIISIAVGTPPVRVYVFVDTNSDLIWLKGGCKACFHPSNSSSYANQSCASASCYYMGSEKKLCTDVYEPCNYKLNFADDSVALGTLSSDKFMFVVPPVDLGFLYFGYSFSTPPQFAGNLRGCLGLNQDYLSFVHQVGITKFSHCMVIPEYDIGGGTSNMYFGSEAEISSEGQVTAILQNQHGRYYVTLAGISVGCQEVPLPPGIFDLTDDGDGGFLVDTGSSYTMLRKEAFDAFVGVMLHHIQLPLATSPLEQFELCFNGTGKDLRFLPTVTFHFHGANVEFEPETAFIGWNWRPGLWCLAILRSVNNLSVLGSMQMRNQLVQYDLEKGLISFAYKDCSVL